MLQMYFNAAIAEDLIQSQTFLSDINMRPFPRDKAFINCVCLFSIVVMDGT